MQPVPQISEAQPIAPAEAPQPIVESQSTLAEEQLIDANSEPTEFDDEQVVDDDAALLRWEGTEYVHSSRSVKWYSIFGIVTVVAVVAAIMVLKSITFAILIPVMVVALLVYVRRAPDVLQYILSRKGIHVNDKLFTFDQFKSFGVVSYNGSHSVVLVPRKRFQIGQTLYFPE